MRKIIYLASIILICILSISTIATYQYYTPPEERALYSIPPNDDTLRIAYIGDSWAYFHQNEHKCHIPSIIEDSCHIPTRIYSYGFPGRTSKEIYEALFDDIEQKENLLKFGYRYCIVSAGINDANKKMNINYYQNSMDYIIRFLLSNNIHPIILEIPDYDIHKAYSWQRMDRKILYRASMLINRIPFNCKQIYRDALDELIHNKNYQEKVSVIRYNSWDKKYKEKHCVLYRIDGIHLNEYGCTKLDSVIAEVIVTNFLKKRKYEYQK